MFCKRIAKNFTPTIYWEERETRWVGEYANLYSFRRSKMSLSYDRAIDMRILVTHLNRYLAMVWRNRTRNRA